MSSNSKPEEKKGQAQARQSQLTSRKVANAKQHIHASPLTDAHPLLRGYELGASICDTAHQVDGGLLHALVAVAQDGREARQEVFDGRRHGGHTDHVHNRLQAAEDGRENVGVLLA
jgi:hypothetical protein